MTRRLDRIELRRDDHRRLVRAVFKCTDREGEITRTLIWEPSEDRYYLEGAEDTDKTGIIKILDHWESMLRPADFELMKRQLGISERARESLKEALSK